MGNDTSISSNGDGLQFQRDRYILKIKLWLNQNFGLRWH